MEPNSRLSVKYVRPRSRVRSKRGGKRVKDGSKKSNKAKGEERGVTEMMNEFTGYGNNLQKHDVQHIGISVHEFPDRETRWLTFTLRIGEEEGGSYLLRMQGVERGPVGLSSPRRLNPLFWINPQVGVVGCESWRHCGSCTISTS